MTPEQVTLVQQTFALVVPVATRRPRLSIGGFSTSLRP